MIVFISFISLPCPCLILLPEGVRRTARPWPSMYFIICWNGVWPGLAGLSRSVLFLAITAGSLSLVENGRDTVLWFVAVCCLYGIRVASMQGKEQHHGPNLGLRVNQSGSIYITAAERAHWLPNDGVTLSQCHNQCHTVTMHCTNHPLPSGNWH